MVIGLLVALQHVAACYLLIHRVGWGYLGAAAASCWSSFLSVGLLAVYVAAAGLGEQVWGRPTREALQGWRTFAGLAYASAGKLLCAG
jgi:MATE family multidrug resistance protein